MTDANDRLIIALDVDGVLNPEGNPAKLPRRGFVKHRGVPGGRGRFFDLWLNPNHGHQLVEFAELLGDAELVWATTWNELANTEIGPRCRLPELPVITVTPPYAWKPGPHWKAAEVCAWAGERPLVWIDDQFGSHDREWAAKRANTLLVRTDARIGLLDEHLDQIQRRWAK